jgi:hypothetical protein
MTATVGVSSRHFLYNIELVIKTCSSRLYFQILQRNKSDSTTRLQLQFGRKMHFQLIAKYKFIYVEMAWR